jgi:hypothetical protein
MGGGIDGCGYFPHIVNCSLVVLHCTVPVTALDTKQTVLTAHDSGYCPTAHVASFLELTSLELATLPRPPRCAWLPPPPPPGEDYCVGVEKCGEA